VDVTYVGALIAGVLSFLSPCVLPLVPPYLCFLGGTTFDQLTGEDETHAVPYTTEAGLFELAGCPAVICGPGNIAQAHAADEYVSLDQLEACTAFLEGLADRLST